MERCQKLTDGPVGGGTRYQVAMKRRSMTVEYVRFDRPRTWATLGDTPKGWIARAGLEGRVVPTAHGVRLAMRRWIEPRGLAGLAAPLMSLLLKSAWRRDLANIKSILERSTPK